ncbi:hypothetical protein, partial [Mycobacterium tuberculosis]|uniref:hypothetical protein n=1 Tax=Mycobacterium tuberculosis TaxID=1773 RepID=UPI0012633944
MEVVGDVVVTERVLLNIADWCINDEPVLGGARFGVHHSPLRCRGAGRHRRQNIERLDFPGKTLPENTASWLSRLTRHRDGRQQHEEMRL